MGSSSGLIHHYFASMDQLLAEAFELAAGSDLARAADFVNRQSNVPDRLAAYLTGHAPSQTDSTMQLWLDACRSVRCREDSTSNGTRC
jgi:AcrR family transcriptional regulator